MGIPKGQGLCVKWLRDRVGYDGSDCLIWPFSRIRGYGNLGFEGKPYYAHRFMCELVNGPPPSPAHEAAHSCGHGEDACVHPKHLSWKTRAENEQDKKAHGSSAWNTRTERYKLTERDVSEIRALYPFVTVTELATLYRVTRSNIRKILKGETWPTGKRELNGFARPDHPYRKASVLGRE